MEKAFNERPQGALPSNTVPNPREEVKVITTRSDTNLAGPSVPPLPPFSSSSKEVERDPETTTDQVHISSPESTARVPSPVIQLAPTSKSSKIPKRNPYQPPIPYPSGLNKDKLQDKSDIQIHKFLQMFKKLHFNISFAEALAHMPKYARILANTPLNENCSAVLLKKLPEKLGDPRKFLIPKLANRSVAYPAGITKDVFVQVGKFTFPANFVVVDYDVDPGVPLISGRPFLRTDSALVDVHEEELILRVGDEKLTFNVDSTSKYPHKHGNESINMS
ncbi:reverse transcriptase domain-containing protein, partial [Tanacetum coccineum]